jgi:hypothetical protein
MRRLLNNCCTHLFFIGLGLCSVWESRAQVTVSSSTNFSAKGELTLRGSFNNSSNQLDLSSTHLNLVGTNQTLVSRDPISVQSLSVEGGGNKTFQGNWTFTRNITFTQGLVVPGTGKIVYTGSSVLNGNTNSFVNGIFYQRGTGTRFFPIGSGSTYAPMAFGSVEQADAEVGVRVANSNASLQLPEDVSSISSNRYWEVSSSGALPKSGVSLYFPGTSVDAAQQLVVVEADNSGGTGTNLGGGISNDFVISLEPASKSILTIGVGEKVDLRVNDLITPFNADEVNDQLKILNIEFTVENTVTLLDRWGAPVKSWKNFRNYDDPVNPNTDNYDFTQLSPGNYICVLEYRLSQGGPLEKVTQMITVLKGN